MPDSNHLNTKLESYGTLWNRDSDFPTVLRQEERAQKLFDHLSKAGRKSFVLVGESGVGKTAALHALFRKLVDDGWRIIETSPSEIARNAIFVGEWQTRLMGLVEAASAQQKVILYMNQLQSLSGAGKSSKSDENMGDTLAQFLEKGDVILVSECTPQAFVKGVESCASLKKVLTTFRVEAPNRKETLDLVQFVFQSVREEVARKTGHLFEASSVALESIVALGGTYFSGISQPGAAIDLLGKTVDWKCNQLDNSEITGFSGEISQSDIVAALHDISGLPVHLLDDNVPLDLKQTREFFLSRVVGQNPATATLVDIITLVKAGLTDPGKPTSILLFAGPTGVGKTELAKALAEFLFGSPERMIRCDMSEYKDYNSFEKFLGRPEREEDPGSLINQVRRQPFSVILLDEVEKANSNIFDVLLQAFDDGRLTDPEGNTADLTQTIIIMTSNLGSDLSLPKPVGFDSQAPETSEMVGKALQNFFRPEFINRIDHIVEFQALELEHIRTLAKRELGKALLRNGLIRRELRVTVEPEVHDLLAEKGYDRKFGARPLRRQVEKMAVLSVAKVIVGMTTEARGSLLRLFVDGDRIGVDVLSDRQTERAQRIAKGVPVSDPVDGFKGKVTLGEADEWLEECENLVAGLIDTFNEEEVEERKSDLVIRSTERDFWDDQKNAREVLGEIYRLERLGEAVVNATRWLEKLQGVMDYLRKEPTEEKLGSFAVEVRAAIHSAKVLQFALGCREEENRRDALIAIRLVDEEAEEDLVDKLSGIYQQWAQRKQYGFRVIHEEVEESGQLVREVVIEITGPVAYGIFRGEAGEHEFIYGKSTNQARSNRFVSVRVLGTPSLCAQDRVSISSKGTKKRANIADRVRTLVTAKGAESGRTVEILSPLESEEAKAAAEDLLYAEIEQSKSGGDTIGEGLVRRYKMSPKLEVVDQRNAGVAIKPRDFWQGDIDGVLHAGILHRISAESSTDV